MKRWIRAYRTVTAPAEAVERVLLEGTVSWFDIGLPALVRSDTQNDRRPAVPTPAR